MLSSRRVLAGVVAVVLAIASGWLSAEAGGSLSTAPVAVVVMAVGLGVAGLSVGVLLGLVGDKAGAALVLVPALVSFYVATLISSPFHSLAGDILVMVIACIPACSGTALGLVVGGHAAASKRA